MSYYRTILRIPVGLTFDQLPTELQAAISRIFGQYVMPMPGTVPADGYVLCDAVTLDTYDPESMAQYGINWPTVGLWTVKGEAEVPFDEAAFMRHLPDPEDGVKVLYEPHKWAGWPDLIVPEAP